MSDLDITEQYLLRLSGQAYEYSAMLGVEAPQALDHYRSVLADRDRLLEQLAQREADYALGLLVANKARELAEDGEQIVRHDLAKMQTDRDRLREALKKILAYFDRSIVGEIARKALEDKHE